MNSRAYERTHVEWPGNSQMRVDLFEQSFEGTVKDVTPEGMFFEPAAAYFNDIPMSRNLPVRRILNMFKRGDKILLKSGKLAIMAEVVWKGESKEHDCSGVGLRFMEE
jgi:hypothetical protein